MLMYNGSFTKPSNDDTNNLQEIYIFNLVADQ